MESFLNRMAEKASKTVRHWWLYLLTGILSIIAGIVVFCNPIESYLTLSIMFGVLMLVSGIVELVVSSTSRSYFTTRSYSIVGGILDLLMGLFLCCYPRVTLVVLPVVLGVWMMFHSFMIIGLGSDMDSFRIRGSGWVIAGGALTGHHILPPDARNSLCGHSHRLRPDRIRHHAYSPEHTSAPHPRALPLPRCRDSRLRL